MRPKTLYLVRGLPGSGKTTFAYDLTAYAFAADQFFELEGEYAFDMARIGEAHAWCQKNVEACMVEELPRIAVHNTLSRQWEAELYYQLAAKYGYEVFVIEVQNDFGNVHGVPDEVIEKMRMRWEPLNRPTIRLRDRIRFRVKGYYYDLRRQLWPQQ